MWTEDRKERSNYYNKPEFFIAVLKMINEKQKLSKFILMIFLNFFLFYFLKAREALDKSSTICLSLVEQSFY